MDDEFGGANFGGPMVMVCSSCVTFKLMQAFLDVVLLNSGEAEFFGEAKGMVPMALMAKSAPVPETRFHYFPKQCGHTEGVLKVSVKARCSIEVGGVVCGIFPCKLPHKMALLKSPCAF